MSVKVELYLHNQYERAVFNECLTIIESAREVQKRALFGEPEAGNHTVMAAKQERPAHPDEAEPQVVGSITPDTVKAAPANRELHVAEARTEIAETEMAMVVQKSLDGRGLAATRELLAPITGGKRWRECDPAVWPAIKVALEAE